MLTQKQYKTIIINAIVVKMLVTYPHSLIVNSGNAAWLNVLYCTLIAVILFGVVRFVYTSRDTVIELSQKIGGVPLRIITGLIVFVVMGVNIFVLIREFPEMIRLVLLQRTYVDYIGLVFVITLILGAWCGIEAIGRVHGLLIPIAGGMFVIFLITLIPSFEFDNLMPILGKGASNIFLKGISSLSIFADLLLLNMLIPHVKNLQDYKKAGTQSIIVGGICAILILLAYGMSYAYPVTEKFVAPVYQLERLIYLSNFFSRFEAVFQFVWSIAIMLYGCIYLAVLAEVWSTTFRLKYSKPLILPIAAIMVSVSPYPINFTDISIIETIINNWLYIPAFALPLILGLIYKIKKSH